ncbi:RNA methyltransferase tRNA(m5U54)methyltransferase [Lecanora helva]
MSSQSTSPITSRESNIDEPISYNGQNYKVVREGAAEILELQSQKNSQALKKGEPKSQSVFYNPVQQYNRDLSVLAIKAFAEDLAAIRKARHQRRLDQPAQGNKQGKKRKRPQAEETSDGNGSEISKVKTAVQPAASDGDREESGLPLKKPNAKEEGQFVEPSNEHQEGHDNGVLAVAGEISTEDGNIEPAKEQEEYGKNGAAPNSPPPFRILDALSATGLRALRYAKEVPSVTSVTANDLSASATKSIKLNAEHNKVLDKIIPSTSDAIEHMHFVASHGRGSQGLYHVIDLDPYGTAAPFLDAAVRALVDGGLLCVTCTDAGVFASVGYLEKTYSQYGGLPIKGPHAHEGGLRLILHAIATSAARYGLAIEPLLSLSIDFYARIFVRIHRSAAEVKFLASKTMVVYSCDTGCGAWTTQHLARQNRKEAKNGDAFYTFTSATAPTASMSCEHCGFKTHQAGPMWGGPLHNPHFIQSLLDMLPTLDREMYGTIPRIEGMLSVAQKETLEDTASVVSLKGSSDERPVPPLDPSIQSHHPFFFLPSALSRVIHCVSPSDAAMRGALLHLGYRVTRSHTKPGSISTDAPWNVIWEIMREWARQKSPVKKGAIKERTAGWGIMQKDRSKRRIIEAKEVFKLAVNNDKTQNVEEFKRDIEAAVHRLSKMEEGFESNDTTERKEGSMLAKAPDTSESHADSSEKPSLLANGQKDQSEPLTSKDFCLHKLDVVFDEELGREAQGKRMVRYQMNPRPDWGPMNRAKGDT